MQLILNTFGASLRRKDGMFQILSGDRQTLIAPAKVDSILAATGVHFSTDAVRLALEHHIDLVLLDSRGDVLGRFWHGRPGSTTALRRRQLEAGASPEGIRLAVEMVSAKLDKQSTTLRDLARTRPDREAALLEHAARVDEQATRLIASGADAADIDEARGTIMGVEGVAGRAYFAGLSTALPTRYRFAGRSRSPAADPFNCLLNYSYGVLYGLVERGCLVTGLDPYIGFLHADGYGRVSLVFDLVELFRHHAERVCVTLCAARKVHDGLFDATARGPAGTTGDDDGRGEENNAPPVPAGPRGGRPRTGRGRGKAGYRLNAEGREVLLTALNEHLDHRRLHGRRKLKIRDTVTYECQRLASRLLKGLDAAVDLSVFDLAAELAAGGGEPIEPSPVKPAPPDDSEREGATP